MKAILESAVARTTASSLGLALVLSALVGLGDPHGAQAGINEWTSNGPYAGSISRLVVDPQTPSTVYAGGVAASGDNFRVGIFKSTDSGTNWTAVLANVWVRALAIDPQTPTTLYAGVQSSYYQKFLKSVDGGATWSYLTIPGFNVFSNAISALAVDPQNPAILYAGVANLGTLKSTDGGASWTAVLPVSASALAIDPQTPATVYAGATDTVYRSSDGGSTWSAVDLTPEPDQSTGSVTALAIDPVTPTTLYAGTASAGSSSSRGGLFKSTDGGATWSAIDTGSAAQLYDVAIDPRTPTTLYAGIDRGALRSLDGGSTWSLVDTGLPDAFVTALAIDPRTPTTLYAGGVAVFKSTDGGDRWRPIGLRGGVFVGALTIDPVTPTTLYAGTTYRGLLKSTDGGARWSCLALRVEQCPFISYVNAVAPGTPTTVYAAIHTGYQPSGIYKSTDEGVSWSLVAAGEIYKALAIDPLTPTTVYALSINTSNWTSSVHKSTDEGISWTEIVLPSVGRALAIDPQTPSTLYVTGGRSLFKSTDAGTSWTDVLPDVFVSALAIDPVTPAIVYAGTLRGGVYKSTDGGSTWNAVNIGLTDLAVSTLAVDPRTPTTLYAGANGLCSYCLNPQGGGVFKSTDGGGSWQALNAGLTNLYVNALVVDPKTPAILHAGTGDGVFSIEQQDRPVPADATTVNFDNPAPPGSTMSGVFQGIDFGTGQWLGSGPYNVNPTNHIYFADSTGTSRSFQFAPAPRVLEGMRVYSTTPGTLTLSDDAGQTFTRPVTTGSLQLVTTGWTRPAATVTVSFTNRWDLGVDDIIYGTAP